MALTLRVIVACCLVAPLAADMETAEGHHHSGMKLEVQPGDSPRNTLQDAEFRRDRDHLKEHMGNKKIDLKNASPEELDFHFFKIHDSDNNNKLDGLELHTALTHAMEAQISTLTRKASEDPRRFKEGMALITEHVVGTVDRILDEEDHNDDGYITYVEYTSNRRSNNALNAVKRKSLMGQAV